MYISLLKSYASPKHISGAMNCIGPATVPWHFNKSSTSSLLIALTPKSEIFKCPSLSNKDYQV